ncbi:TPA: ParB/RepB/Spo0J family partition protein [Vibrio vulnificus]|nr:ParB/RepB/Spo0J family partition protein [Vibrio vulnificus]
MTTNKNQNRTATDYLAHFGLSNSGAASSDNALKSVGEHVSLEYIRPDPTQPRKEINTEEFDNLKVSMDDVGLIEPIVIRPDPVNPSSFFIVVGERRYRAAVELKWKSIPSIIRHDLSDSDVLLIQMAENLVKSEMTTAETAHGFVRLMDEFNLNQREIGRITGYSTSTINELVGIVKGPECIASLINTVKTRPLVILKRAHSTDPDLVEDHLAQRLKNDLPVSLSWAESIHALVKQDDTESDEQININSENTTQSVVESSSSATESDATELDRTTTPVTSEFCESDDLPEMGGENNEKSGPNSEDTNNELDSPTVEFENEFPNEMGNGFTRRPPSKAIVSVLCADGSFGRLALEYAPTEPDSLMVEDANGVVRSVQISNVKIAGYE